jgi:hypothetical protein
MLLLYILSRGIEEVEKKEKFSGGKTKTCGEYGDKKKERINYLENLDIKGR